jgi:LCP family protein required for cell wall assembly
MVDLSKNINLTGESKRPSRKKKTITWLAVFFVLSFIYFSGKAIVSQQKPNSWVYKVPVINQIKRLAEGADKNLKGEEQDRINILLLGIGGKNHDGGNLTDTIILASFQPSTKKVAMLSIPRDLNVPLENLGWRKINNVNSYAEAESPGSGGIATSQAVNDLLGVPIDYYFRLDFSGFENIIDALGGIEVEVENTLDDRSYPVLGREDAEPYESRYEHLHVEQGIQKMDGDLALKFVRSRHAGGIEGSDFARARRQQLVLEAVKNKFISKNTLFRPGIIKDIYNELEAHLSTNMEIWEMIKLYEMFADVQKDNIINKVLDNSANGLLMDNITPEGAYVLVPRTGDFTEIQYLANNIFSTESVEVKQKVKVEKANVEVRNGTWINGLASQKAIDIEKMGFEVIRVGNSSRQNFEKTVIYDLTFGEKKESLSVLKEKLGANITLDLPQWLRDDIAKESEGKSNYQQPDFLVILGQDADASASGAGNTE